MRILSGLLLFSLYFLKNSLQIVTAEKSKVVEIYKNAGTNLILKCPNDCSKVQWKFANCTECNENSNSTLIWSDLKAVIPSPKSSNCWITLSNLTVLQNGFYGCFKNNQHYETPLYQLKVLQNSSKSMRIMKFEFIGRAPQVTSLEASTPQIKTHQTILLTCQVSSPLIPKIIWFKECERTDCDLRLPDNGRTYYNINSSINAYPLSMSEKNSFVGKLKLHNFTSLDNGVYVCVALTDLGSDHRNITLIVTEDSDFLKFGTFFFLCAVPLVFILLPACVWLCYFKKKHYERSKNQVFEN